MKLLEDNTEENTDDAGYDDDFVGTIPKSWTCGEHHGGSLKN